MSYMFISDIHGSSLFLKQALEIFKEEQLDCLVILGDILYHGPRNPIPEGYNPQEVIKVLNEMDHTIIAVRGNCDSEVDQMVLKFKITDDYNTVLYNGRKLFFTHGHIYNEDQLPPLNEGDVFFNGHFHISKIENNDGIILCNPGSITLPKDGTNSFGILKNNELTIRNLENEIIQSYSLK